MKKKTLLFALLLILSGYIPSVTAQMTVPNPNEIIVAWTDMLETVDPHWANDTASLELIMNVYGSLTFFDVDRTTMPEYAGLVDQFVGDVAESWVAAAPPDPAAPPGTNNTYYFNIRTGIPWQDGAYGTVTPADVEYSFERWMVLDRTDGPTWMIYQPLLGVDHANTSDPNWPTKIDNAVQRNDTHVWFNLVAQYPPFLQTLCMPCASILDKDWAIAQGCWPQTWNNWLDYHDPAISPLDDPAPVMMGSGPYSLDYIDYIAEKWSITRFVDYWAGWPAVGCAGYAERCTYIIVDEWAARKILFLSNDPAAQADIVDVPVTGYASLEDPPGSGNALAGVRYYKDLPSLKLSTVFMNLNASNASQYLGPGFDPYDPYRIAEDRVPIDFFSDVNVRKGFAYSFNWTRYISTVYLNETTQPASPLIKGLGFDDVYAANNDPLKYSCDPTQAQTAFQAAFGGQLWTNGFTFTITYDTGNTARREVALLFEEYVELLNPLKFHVEILEVSPATYASDLLANVMPLFVWDWSARYPDPHDFFFPLVHTLGDFCAYTSYSNATIDTLIDAELATTDRDQRALIFAQLMQAYHDDVPSIPLVQPLERHYERTWIRGWYYNPAYPGFYFYHLWKSDEGVNAIGVWRGDANGWANIWCINIFDAGFVSSHWSAVGLPYDPRADLNQDGWVDILDAGRISGTWHDVPMNP